MYTFEAQVWWRSWLSCFEPVGLTDSCGSGFEGCRGLSFSIRGLMAQSFNSKGLGLASAYKAQGGRHESI